MKCMELPAKIQNLKETGWSFRVSFDLGLWEVCVWKRLNPKGKFDKKRIVKTCSDKDLNEAIEKLLERLKTEI